MKDYLLKPVAIDELLITVQKLRKELILERDKTRQYKELLIANSLKQQISGKKITDMPDMISNMNIYPFFSSIRSYYDFLGVKNIEQIKEYKRNWRENIDNSLRHLGMECISFFLDENVLLTAIYKWTKEFDLSNFQLNLNDEIFYVFGVNTPVNQFWLQYPIMINTHKYATISRKKYFFQNDIKFLENKKKYNTKRINPKIMEAFFSGKQELVFSLIEELFRGFEQSRLLLDQVVDNCNNLVQMLINKYQKLMPYNYVDGLKLNYQGTSSLAAVFNSYELLKHLLQEDITELYDNILGDKKEDNWQMIRILKYINEFYMKDIKAYEVADYINISPNYFSTLFKQKTGISFNEYLNKVRIEKALILLKETSDQVSTIANDVGYHEYKYFAQVFKKITNLTPTEYRNMQK